MTQTPDLFVTRFQELYFEEFGEHIDEREALNRLNRLTNVLRVLVYAPLDRPFVPPPPSLDDSRISDTLKKP